MAVRRTLRTVVTILSVIAMGIGSLVQLHAAAQASEVTLLQIHVTVAGDNLVSGDRIAKVCNLETDAEFDRNLTIEDGEGSVVETYQLQDGKIYDGNKCRFSFEFPLGESESYTFRTLSIFEQTIEVSELASERWRLSISVIGGDGVPLFGESNIPSNEVAATPIDLPDAGPIAGSDLVRVVGRFELRGREGDDFDTRGSECIGLGGYEDIRSGAQVIVSDETREIIASSRLEPDPSAGRGLCSFVFIVEVPDAKFYTFTLGRRGDLTFTTAEMEEMNWEPIFLLGE